MTGAVVARNMVVRKSSAMPWANLARMSAVAGAMTSASVDCAASMCSTEPRRFPSWPEPSVDPEAGNDLVASEGGEGERRDELLRGRSHHDVHVEGVLLQIANQLRGFVGSDAAGDADCDLHEYRVQGGGCGVQRTFGAQDRRR